MNQTDRGAQPPMMAENSPAPPPAWTMSSPPSRNLGMVRVSTLAGIGYLENDQFVPTAAPGGLVGSLTEDSTGNLWIANRELGLLRLSPRNELQQIPWTTFGRTDPAIVLAQDPLHGGLWLGFSQGGVVWFRDGQVRSSYSAAEGLGEGRVNDLRFDGGSEAAAAACC